MLGSDSGSDSKSIFNIYTYFLTLRNISQASYLIVLNSNLYGGILRKIFGHRGLPRIYPENTLSSINKAFEYCDFVETFDVP